ncbi:MAG TPA: O-antigen ligase family protein [Pseudomonas sp.]|nr:O-antigen ligase family protein [Pseudomonas sp.]
MLRGLALRQDVLARWALIGLLIFLCVPWWMPSNKHYHHLIHVFLWMPVLLALCVGSFRQKLKQPEMLLFALLAAWTLLIVLLHGDHGTKAKMPFYVLLTLLGVLLAAQDSRWSLERLLAGCVLVGALGALVSIVCFYATLEPGSEQRLITPGLWDRAIMAAHAVGALAMLGVFLCWRPGQRPWFVALLVIALLAYIAFLALNQTRGVWLALFAALVMMVVALPSRQGLIILLLVLAGVAGVALFEPQILLQRGLSYRPTLWAGGVQLIRDNWLLGLGFDPYEIAVPALQKSFKHPHNLFLDTGVRLGIPGLLLFLLLWGATLRRAWQNREGALGRALLALWTFSSVALLSDGIGLWLKPNADWLITWLPIALGMVLAMRQVDADRSGTM